jgi:hypothetical protein
MHVLIDNYIVSDGEHQMRLLDAKTNAPIASATRTPDGWLVATPESESTTATRSDAMDAMIAALPVRDSWTTQEEPGLRELP